VAHAEKRGFGENVAVYRLALLNILASILGYFHSFWELHAEIL